MIFHYLGTPNKLDWIKTPDAKRWVSGIESKPGQSFKSLFPQASDASRSLIKSMLTMDPHQRISVQGCLQSEWLKDLYNATVQSHIKKIREIRKTKAVIQSGNNNKHNINTMNISPRSPASDSSNDDELDYCKDTFDLSGEFEAKINTLFGVRHLMYEELINFHRNRHKKLHSSKYKRSRSNK